MDFDTLLTFKGVLDDLIEQKTLDSSIEIQGPFEKIRTLFERSLQRKRTSKEIHWQKSFDKRSFQYFYLIEDEPTFLINESENEGEKKKKDILKKWLPQFLDLNFLIKLKKCNIYQDVEKALLQTLIDLLKSRICSKSHKPLDLKKIPFFPSEPSLLENLEIPIYVNSSLFEQPSMEYVRFVEFQF